MRYLHAAALLRPPSGIINQMRWEHEAACELAKDWDVKLYCPQGWLDPEAFIEESRSVKAGDPTRAKLIDWIKFRYGFYQWLMSQVEAYDAFVLRYYVHDPFQLRFVKCCNKPVYFVHHTLEEPELRISATLPAKFRAACEHLSSIPTLKSAAGIIGVTQEIVNYEVYRAGLEKMPTFVYPNGIRFDREPVEDFRGDTPEFLFMAGAFSAWHGLDLLLDSLEKSKVSFKLHLVGKVYEPDLSRASADTRVVLHGNLSTDEIRHLASSCWLGLSSFGLHRKNMTEACTLKVREYLMMGLPVYLGHNDVIKYDNEYLRIGHADIDEISRVANDFLVDRRLVSKSSEKTISKKNLLSNLINELDLSMMKK